VVDGEEDKTVWVYLEERFGSKTAINFGNFLFRLLFWHSCRRGVKGGILGLSPKQIMTGEVVHYVYCSIPFGCYCQISKEGTPRDSMLARTWGAIALGPSGKVQGGHKFYALDTRSVVVRRQWVRLLMSEAVIARIERLAFGQPSQPVYID